MPPLTPCPPCGQLRSIIVHLWFDPCGPLGHDIIGDTMKKSNGGTWKGPAKANNSASILIYSTVESWCWYADGWLVSVGINWELSPFNPNGKFPLSEKSMLGPGHCGWLAMDGTLWSLLDNVALLPSRLCCCSTMHMHIVSKHCLVFPWANPCSY